MITTDTIASRPEQRKRLRVRHNAMARIALGPGRVAAARCIEAGRGGLRLISAVAPVAGGRVVVKLGGHEFLGRVAWTRPVRRGHTFGVQIFRDQPGVELALSEVIYDALNVTGETDSLRDTRQPLPGWTDAPAGTRPDAQGLVLSRLSLGAAAGFTLGLVLTVL